MRASPKGSDYIKLILDDASAYGGHRPTLSKETLTAAIAAAHKRGKLTVVHIGTLQDAEEAINAGADGLAHLFVGPKSDPDFGRLVASHHAFVVPTLTVLKSVCGTAGGEPLINRRASFAVSRPFRHRESEEGVHAEEQAELRRLLRGRETVEGRGRADAGG
jgi:hypothetical protein